MKKCCGTCGNANWRRAKDNRRMGGPSAHTTCFATIPGEPWPEGYQFATFTGRLVGVEDHKNCPAWKACKEKKGRP